METSKSTSTGGESAVSHLGQVAEALIFGADEAVRPERIAEVFADVRGVDRPSNADVERAIDELNGLYEATGRSLRIHPWAEGYRMATIPEVAPYLKSFLDLQRTRRLSRSLMETLAVVAYKQPVTKPEVDFVRGVDSDYALRKLMELEMVDVVGRSDAVGRPLFYGTSNTFLEKFGMRNLDALPNLREVEELLSDPAFSSEKARLLMRNSLFDIDAHASPQSPTELPGGDGADLPADPAPPNGSGEPWSGQ